MKGRPVRTSQQGWQSRHRPGTPLLEQCWEPSPPPPGYPCPWHSVKLINELNGLPLPSLRWPGSPHFATTHPSRSLVSAPNPEGAGCPWGGCGTAGCPSPTVTLQSHCHPSHPPPAGPCPARAASPLCLRPSRKHLQAVNLIKVSEKRCLGAPPGSAALNFIRSGLLLITPAASLINNGRVASRCQARRGKGFVCLFLSSLGFGWVWGFFLRCGGRAGARFPSEK